MQQSLRLVGHRLDISAQQRQPVQLNAAKYVKPVPRKNPWVNSGLVD